ncbi:hypothetical protein IC582_010229 [Cucumis melo]|uniref:Transcription factor bHLH92 n=2 Tax=Cucumis melo TaxID=3656 RepID=A0A5A7UQX2_CUCMM|nr:transcription factor bHLH92 [Cucumis melo var. makuwa]TYK08199.1 transcription factor bHLH92 [Cucumis melo var. makuwa]
MDDTFPVEFWHNDHFWLDAPISVPLSAPSSPPPATQISAFLPYLSAPPTGLLGQDNNNIATTTTTAATSYDSRNVNKRMIEYWTKHWHEKKELPVSAGDLEREKCHRHMLNERMRREKQKQSYLALHSMLPKNTKNDKNSIVQSAARTIQEMKGLEKTLKRRNSELEMEIAIAMKKKEKEKRIINVALRNTSCGINSMLTVLNVLKTVGVNSKAIHATFFNSQFSAQLAIDTHMGAAEVERALQVTLNEAERKFRRQYSEGSKEIKDNYFKF